MELQIKSVPINLCKVTGSLKIAMPTAAATKGSTVAKMEALPASTSSKPQV